MRELEVYYSYIHSEYNNQVNNNNENTKYNF